MIATRIAIMIAPIIAAMTAKERVVRTCVPAAAAVAVLLAATAPAALAADQAEFQSAYAAAQQAEQQAGALRDRWTPTEAALKQAKQAADATNYDVATNLAREAETLAKISVQQARAQETAWRDAVVH
jgi:ribosomal protein L7/L12